MSHRPGGAPGHRQPRTADGELSGRGPGRGGIIIVLSRESAGGGGPALGPGLRGERRFRDYHGARPMWAPQRPGREGKTKGGKGKLPPAGSRLQPGFCRPAASRPRGPPPSRLLGVGAAQLPGEADTCLCSRSSEGLCCRAVCLRARSV